VATVKPTATTSDNLVLHKPALFRSDGLR